jgi:predicted aspartyl protease
VGLVIAAIAVALAGEAPAAAPASPASDPAGTLARIRAALSAGRPIDSVAAVRTVADVVMDGEVVGSAEAVGSREPLRYREVLEIAGARQSATVVGDRGWYVDPNGHAREVSGDELATYVLGHALLFHTYLESDPPGFSREIDAGGITFVPEGSGASRRLELGAAADPDLPSRLVQRQQGTDVATTLEDWREIDGIRFPLVSTQTTGDARFDVRLVATDVELLDALPADAILPPESSPPDDARLTDPTRAAAIPLELVGGLPLVQVEVHGRPGLSFLVDSGAGATVLAASLADSLGLEARGTLEARGGGGSEAASFADIDTLRLPGVEVTGQIVVTLPLAELGRGIGRPVHGILGWDFLSRFAVEIDYPAARLRVFPSGGYDPPAGATRLPLRLEANVPRVEGSVEGRPGSFLLDTGNSSSLFLHSRFAREAGLLERAEESALRIHGIGGEEKTLHLVVDRLALGPLAWEGVPAAVSTAAEGILALDEAIGNVGSGLLRDSVVALDYRAGSLWIAPSSASASDR